LTTEELEILECLSKPEQTYCCLYCSRIPLLSFSVVKYYRNADSNKELIELTLLEHNWDKKKGEYISHRFRDEKLSSALSKCCYSYIENHTMKYLFCFTLISIIFKINKL